jgi:aryl-alcohol dehydrogenase-like predicted oxidoreductase
LKNPAVTGAIVGVRNAQQARPNVGAASFELTSDEVAEIEDRVVREAA